MKRIQVCTASGAAAAGGVVGVAGRPLAVPKGTLRPGQPSYDAAAAWFPGSSPCVGEEATQAGGGRLRGRARTSPGSGGVGGERCSGALSSVGSSRVSGSAPAAWLSG